MEPTVEIAAGKLRGSTQAGICAFKGIPYAVPPVGTHRFMPPRPPEPWAGTRDALGHRGRAPQWQAAPTRRPGMATFLGPADTSPETEDCLNLHVWTPGLDNAKRPVMVWLHGGAFHFGSANRAVTDGANLARRGDVVVVSANHRLNILGHLHLADLGGERYAHSGNAGVLDLIAALEWVRDNIGQFGGDPGNVTIFGESGGGGKVSVLLAMPAASGLFHRAVIQSGAALRVTTRERANALAEAALKQLGITRDNLDRLDAIPAEQLVAAITPAKRIAGRPERPLLDRYDFGPVVDGADLPQQPCDPGPAAISDAIPLLIGDTKDEATRFLTDDDAVWNRTLTEAQLRTRLAAIAGGEADRVFDLYRTRDPQGNPAELLIAALTHGQFWVRSSLFAERKAARRNNAKGAPVYMYSLAWETPACDGRLKAPHALDLPFVFDNTEVADATVGRPTSAASKNFSSLLPSQNGLPSSSGARLISASPRQRSISAAGRKPIRSTRPLPRTSPCFRM